MATSTLAFESDGRVKEYDGGYDDYLRQRPSPIAVDAPVEPVAKPARAAPKERPKKLSNKERRELDELPARIEALEANRQALHDTMADPTFYRRDGDTIADARPGLTRWSRNSPTPTNVGMLELRLPVPDSQHGGNRLLRLWIARLFLIAWLLAFVYLTLVWLPINQPPPNLVPFRTIRHDWFEGGYSFWVNLVGNVAFFLPAGLLLPWSRQRTTTFAYVATWRGDREWNGRVVAIRLGTDARRTWTTSPERRGRCWRGDVGAVPAALLNLFRPSVRMVEKFDRPAIQAIAMSMQVQQVFLFRTPIAARTPDKDRDSDADGPGARRDARGHRHRTLPRHALRARGAVAILALSAAGRPRRHRSRDARGDARSASRPPANSSARFIRNPTPKPPKFFATPR